MYRLLLVLLLPTVLFGQTPKPGTQDIPDEPGLPRVLLIGDSIAGGYAPVVRERLKGKANVHLVQRRILPFKGDTNDGVAEIDSWLTDTHWDVIHFNWGLWDLKVGKDDRNVVPIEQYGKNLRDLVRRMKQSQATLLFATTTPVPERALDPVRRTSDVLLYNAVALKIMQEEGIRVDDLYSFVLPHLAEVQGPNDVHYEPRGYELLGERVAASILFMIPFSKHHP